VSPDGRSIVYATDRTGNGDLYVVAWTVTTEYD
jgi:Tol biopolymer transport system component